MGLLVPVLRRLFTGRTATPLPPDGPDETVIAIQQAMLATLGETGNGHGMLRRRITHASDLQKLWHLRGELMGAVAGLQGEAAARTVLLEISEEFEGLLPGGLSTRPSPLGRH